MEKIFKISGMHCSSCSKLIESELEDNGILSKVDSISGRAAVNFNPKIISEDKIKSIIKALGYRII